MNQTAGVNTVVIDHFAANLMQRDEQEEDLFAGEMMNGHQGGQKDQMDWTEEDPVSPIRAPEYQRRDPNKVFESNFMARESQAQGPTNPPQKKLLTLHSAPKPYYQPEPTPASKYVQPQQQAANTELRNQFPPNYQPNIWSVGVQPGQTTVHQAMPGQRIYSEQPASNTRLEYNLPARNTEQQSQYTSVQYNSNNPAYQPPALNHQPSPFSTISQPVQYIQSNPQRIVTNAQPQVKLNQFAPLTVKTQPMTITNQHQPIYRPQVSQNLTNQQYVTGNTTDLQPANNNFSYQPIKTYY